MEKRFVKIRGKLYRVEVNWNTFEDFARLKGMPITDTLSLSLQEGDNLKVMMTAALREGERLEGREFDLTPVQVGEILNPVAIKQLVDVYRDHFIGDDGQSADPEPASDDEDAKKKPGPTGS